MPAVRRTLAAFLAFAVASAAFAADPPAPPPAAPDPAKLVEALKGKDKPTRLEAAQQAKAVDDDRLVAPLVAMLDDEDLTLRHAAIEALGARKAPESRRKAAAALGSSLSRLAKKPDAEIDVIATAQALGGLAQPSSIDVLTADIGLETSPDVVRTRLLAVANLPCAEAIEALIQFLSKNGRGRNGQQLQACRQALRAATGEDFGGDPDKWRAWWKEAKKSFDFESAARRREAERTKQDDGAKRKREKKDKKDDGGDEKK